MGRPVVAFLMLPELLGRSSKPASREHGKTAEGAAVQPDSSCNIKDLRGSEVGANPRWAAGRLSKGLVSLQSSSSRQPLVVSLFCVTLLGLNEAS